MICPVCKGAGYTKKSSPEFHFDKREAPLKGKQYVTDKTGSGCLECRGTGSVPTESIGSLG